MGANCNIFHQCLYFTTHSLCRATARMAEEEFAVIGFSPSYAFILTLVDREPGIMPTGLADALNLAPSTITRFLDKLEHQGLLERRAEGRTARVYLTERGVALRPTIESAWTSLYSRYVAALGEEAVLDLIRAVDNAATKLNAIYDSR